MSLAELDTKKRVKFILSIMSRQIDEAQSLEHLYDLFMGLADMIGEKLPVVLLIYKRCFTDYGRGYREGG